MIICLSFAYSGGMVISYMHYAPVKMYKKKLTSSSLGWASQHHPAQVEDTDTEFHFSDCAFAAFNKRKKKKKKKSAIYQVRGVWNPLLGRALGGRSLSQLYLPGSTARSQYNTTILNRLDAEQRYKNHTVPLATGAIRSEVLEGHLKANCNSPRACEFIRWSCGTT